MSDRRTIDVDVELSGGLTVDVDFGQVVTEIVLPDPYEGETTVTPTSERQTLPTRGKTVETDITILPMPEPDLRPLSVNENGQYQPDDFDGYDEVTVNVPSPVPVLDDLTIDTLTHQGTFLPTGDGFSQVTAEEQWDDVLYPIPDDPDNVFNAKHVNVKTGDKIIVEGVGTGRWFGFRNATTAIPASVRVTLRTGYYDYMRFKYDVDCDCILVLAGYNSSQDGTHSTNSAYQFRGEYLKWKVIHAS